MYTFKTSEMTNDKATEFETKSLLYLMNKVKGHNKMNIFIIDCFNDVSGTNSKYSEVWDVQSKGVSSLTPRKIGISLYTLYSNYVSELSFHHYILFMPILMQGYLDNETLEVFDIFNFSRKNKANLEKGLQDEIVRRHNNEYPDSTIETLSDEELNNVSEFTKEVVFVTDRYQKYDYVKEIITFKNTNIKPDAFFTRIFDEIRVLQSGKKIANIYGKSISTIGEVIHFHKNIYRKDIEMLVINRIVGYDIFSSMGVPLCFLEHIRSMDSEDIKDLVQNCRAKITKTLFNKNNKKPYWLLLEEIINLIVDTPSAGVDNIFQSISPSIRDKVFTFDDDSLLYFIALVKDGLDNDNN